MESSEQKSLEKVDVVLEEVFRDGSYPEYISLYLGIKALLSKHTPFVYKPMPIDNVQWVDKEMVVSNDYNPNSVAKDEMRLLYLSIIKDGYTSAIVTIYDPAIKKYVIVDGFHRHLIFWNYKDVQEATHGLLPIVVIEKDINDRMASTVRHNEARGRHSVTGMANMVFKMLENGWTEAQICNELGMETEQIIRLKHVTGFSKLFENVQYRKSWETRKQIILRHSYKNTENE